MNSKIRLLAAAAALFCTSCDPKFAKALLDVIGPFACEELQQVTEGNKVVGVACPAAKALLDAWLSKHVGASPATSCDKHLVVLDARGHRVGFLCESSATTLAAAVGGRSVAP